MAKYKLKVEVIEENLDSGKTDDELLNGIDCSGFFAIVDRGDHFNVIMHNLSTMNVAGMMAQSRECMVAAKLAISMREMLGT